MNNQKRNPPKLKFLKSIGWVGNIALSIGIIPQVIQTWKTHDVSSFSWLFLLLWCGGVIMVFIYIAGENVIKKSYQWSLWLNYAINIIGTFYLVIAKILY